MLCPRCQQGDVAKTQIKRTEKEIYVCEECEAAWFSQEEIGNSPFFDFGTYMDEIGLPPTWDELKKNY